MLYFYYSVCRANGNTLLPGTLMMVTSVLNLILDPIFIFTFDLGIDGAAIATIIAFGVGIAIVAPKVASANGRVISGKISISRKASLHLAISWDRRC